MTAQVETTKCPHCGGIASIETRGHLETITCRDCGWSQQSTVYPQEAVGLIEDSPSDVTVRIDWASDMSLRDQVVAAKQTFGELADRPTSELLGQARNAESLEIGTFPKSLAIELQERGKAHGLQLSFVDVVE